MCLLYDENTRRLTESGFMENPGIEPAIPGLQGICLSPTPRQLLCHTCMGQSCPTGSMG